MDGENEATDLSIPTKGFPLEASRHYLSSHAIDGPTGLGWSSSFHARLHYQVYLYAAPSTYQRKAEVIFPDGNHFAYTDTRDVEIAPGARGIGDLLQPARCVVRVTQRVAVIVGH